MIILDWKISTLKSHDHESESYNKFKKFLLKNYSVQSLANIATFGHFFLRYVIFLRHQFCRCHICIFQLEFLSCAIFVWCHYFQMGLKVPFLLGVRDGCHRRV